MAQKDQGPPPTGKTSKPGIFGSIMKEVKSAGKEVEKGLNWAGNQIEHAVKQCETGNILQTFQTNNVVQLVSRASGHSLQIVMSTSKQSVIDGCGAEGPQASNTLWTVINEGKNQVRLHNNNNYIAIVNGITQLVHMPPGTMHGEETKIQLHQTDQFVTMESCKTVAQYVGVLEDGQLKSALATHRNDTHAMFGVRLISTPYDGAPGKQ
ncbi:uncharacterized protein LOC127700639 [Mytilus californianus]|uniref:uncharacterized protein LOC127700639 n=1 Tax=Mytilus californianus TaxID=6549 RepID=UPI00224672C8|nr:uncharacterized protein LOC127700639 [Mytilus californianus]XP_052060155.1 uncharacterized protein LOC127700639 [Mytilus californianus]